MVEIQTKLFDEDSFILSVVLILSLFNSKQIFLKMTTDAFLRLWQYEKCEEVGEDRWNKYTFDVHGGNILE
jgi:hypothetical protein